MSFLLKLALAMDRVSHKFGMLAAWTVLLAALISAGNAFVRHGMGWLAEQLGDSQWVVLDAVQGWYSLNGNAMLEVQWYLFAYMVMVGAPHVLKLNEHVRVDLIYGKLKGKGPVYVDLFGLVFFLLPVMGLLCYLSTGYFLGIYHSGEMSQNAGGLIRWPATLAMPVGFALVFLQGLGEVVKRIAYLRGVYQMDTHYEKPLQ